MYRCVSRAGEDLSTHASPELAMRASRQDARVYEVHGPGGMLARKTTSLTAAEYWRGHEKERATISNRSARRQAEWREKRKAKPWLATSNQPGEW